MKEEILKLVKRNNGIITTSQIEDAGFSRVYIKPLVDEGLLVRQKQGVYADPNILKDEFYIFQVKHPSAIFSYETALYLLNIVKEKPEKMDVTVYTGYNTHRFKDDVVSHYIKKELHEADVIEVTTEFGNKVKVYSPARTICDMIKTTTSDNLITNVLTNYFDSEIYDENNLLECANKLNCYKKLNYKIGISYLTNRLDSKERRI